MRRGCWARLAVVALLAVTGCLDASASHCADGSACRPGTICIAGLELCADPGQLDACVGLDEGEGCDADGIPLGTCTMGVCIGVGCGNGVVDDGEVCDDHNSLSGDGCSADCKSTEVCGNKIVDRDEQCDCGTAEDVNPSCRGPNADASGPCSFGCRLRCGDGVVSPDEGCDPGASAVVSCAGEDFDRGLTTCTASCQPMLSPDSCRYIGWRTRAMQMPPGLTDPVIELAPIAVDSGLFIQGNVVNTYTAYTMFGTPFGASALLLGVWAADADHAFAVGAQGVIVEWSGASWTEVDSGTTVTLRDVWGRAADDVYAIGENTVLHYDGTTWSSLAPPVGAFRAVAGDATAVYVAGDQGTLLRWNGSQWQSLSVGTSEDLRSVWSDGAVVVAVGKGGTIVQNDGSGWVPGRSVSTADLLSVWGSTVDGFVAVGDRGTVLFYDGHVWRPMTLGRGVTGSQNQLFRAVTGIPGVAIGIVGTDDVLGYDGAAWSPTVLPTAETMYAIWGVRTDDVFAVGRNGTILHHDGLVWTIQPSPVSVDLRAVWGTSGDDVYAAGDDLTLLHYDGTTWSLLRQGTAGGVSGSFRALSLTTPSTVIAGGTVGIFTYSAGTLVQSSSAATNGLWSATASDVWAVGTSVLRNTGAGWSSAGISTPKLAISGTSGGDVYVVGPSSSHWNGTAWLPGPFNDSALEAVCAQDALGAFAAGQDGALQYWSGTALEPMVSRSTLDIHAVFTIDNLVFMAGDDGTLQLMIFHR